MLKKALAGAPARYLVVGGVCALINNAILIGADAAGLHYFAAMALAAVLVLPPSYLVHAGWTFRVPASWHGFGRYVAGSASSLVVATVMIWLLRGVLDMPMWAAGPLATVAMIVYNYLMARWAVAHGRDTRTPAWIEPA